MKVAIAIVAAAGICVASFLVYEVVALKGEIEGLRAERAEAPAAPQGGEAARLADLESRIALLERTARTPAAPAEPSGTGLAPIEAHLAAHDEELAAIRKDLEGVRRVRGALDEGADRVLSALGEGPAGEGGGAGGLARLGEIAALWRKSPEELTPEERAQRERMAGQVRQRMVDWAIDGFDRTLDEKLSDAQRADIRLAVEDEMNAIEDLRNQNLSEEERETRQAEIRAETDRRAEKILTPKQFEAYKNYRARFGRPALEGSLRGRRMGGVRP